MRGGVRFTALAVLAAAMLVVPAGTVSSFAARKAAGDWVEDGFDAANTHFDPNETVLGTANVSQLTGSWNLKNAAGSAPVVVGDHVYAESTTAVSSFNRFSGALEWSSPVKGSALNGTVAYAGGVLYTAGSATSANLLSAFDASTGAVLWTLKIGFTSGWPLVVADGVVYIGDAYRTLYAVDTATHKVKWKFKAKNEVGRPAIANGNVYVGSFDDHLYSLSEATGAKQWSFDTDSPIFSAPSVANGIVYIGQKAGTMFAVDANAGTLRWKFQTKSIFTTDAAIANGTAYFAGHDDFVYAVNATTGKQRWKFKTADINITNPVVANGVVYVSSNDKNLYALDAATGAKLLTIFTGVAALSNVVISNGDVFGGFPSGHLRRFTLPD